MRYLLISDIHANLAAFKAVLDDAEGHYDKIWCLGDMVGYGPDPNACIDLLLQKEHVCIAGNHDWAVLGKLDVDDFNPDARHVSLWTCDELTESNRMYLQELPTVLVEEPFTLVHGSPRHPIWEYVLYPAVAKINFDHFSTRYCLVGHTHSPVIFYDPAKNEGVCEAEVPAVNNGPEPLGDYRLILNPGSVGQPRDGDARTSYGILDAENLTFEYHRIPYPLAETQEKMKKLDFPPRLINRLGYGW